MLLRQTADACFFRIAASTVGPNVTRKLFTVRLGHHYVRFNAASYNNPKRTDREIFWIVFSQQKRRFCAFLPTFPPLQTES